MTMNTTESTTVLVIPRYMESQEFWANIMGGASLHGEYWLGVKYLNDAKWDVPGEVRLAIEDEEGDTVVKTLTVADLLSAYNVAISKPYYHCGGRIDIEDMDECASDIVLQIAMLGDVIYG
jgi:hypothetical protein